jgi:myo-inositol 2-dehydrogenase / D-chiro-inositol 1-dehydrogenase
VSLRVPPTTTSWRFTHNGYQAEWQHLADVVDGRAELAIPLQTAVDDMTYALDIAERAEAALR